MRQHDSLSRLSSAQLKTCPYLAVHGIGKNCCNFFQDTVASGDINANEIIIGANKDEGLLGTGNFLVDKSLYETTQKYFDIIGPIGIFGKRFQDNVTDINELDIEQAHQVLKHYVGEIQDISEEREKQSKGFLNFSLSLTDTMTAKI